MVFVNRNVPVDRMGPRTTSNFYHPCAETGSDTNDKYSVFCKATQAKVSSHSAVPHIHWSTKRDICSTAAEDDELTNTAMFLTMLDNESGGG